MSATPGQRKLLRDGWLRHVHKLLYSGPVEDDYARPRETVLLGTAVHSSTGTLPTKVRTYEWTKERRNPREGDLAGDLRIPDRGEDPKGERLDGFTESKPSSQSELAQTSIAADATSRPHCRPSSRASSDRARELSCRDSLPGEDGSALKS